MANHKQALKRYRQSINRRERNRINKRRMATAVKKAVTAREAGGEEAADLTRQAATVIARVASKGVIPRKRAARKISRLMKSLNA